MELKWKIIHWAIVINFVISLIYSVYQIFVVMDPGTSGPLWGAATDLDFEYFLKRRLYAIEFWIQFVGFAIYMAIVYRDQLKAGHTTVSQTE